MEEKPPAQRSCRTDNCGAFLSSNAELAPREALGPHRARDSRPQVSTQASLDFTLWGY